MEDKAALRDPQGRNICTLGRNTHRFAAIQIFSQGHGRHFIFIHHFEHLTPLTRNHFWLGASRSFTNGAVPQIGTIIDAHVSTLRFAEKNTVLVHTVILLNDSWAYRPDYRQQSWLITATSKPQD